MKEMYELATNDFVGISFWIISAAMVAATAFFWMERDRAEGKWKTSLSVAALVTGIAAIHYFYMRGFYVASGGESPVVFRYVDWLLTVPLQIVEFYLILKAAGATWQLMWKLILLSTVMLVAGYFGEGVYTGGNGPALWGLISGLAYFAIVYEIWKGEASKLAATAGGAVLSAHKTLVKFVVIGWAIYPIGYMAGTQGWYGAAGEFFGMPIAMDVIYNVGDAINKIGFGLVVYNLSLIHIS